MMASQTISRVICLLSVLWVALEASGAEKIDFNFEIRPLLSDRCLPCHGPDAKTRMADLRLDLPGAKSRAAKSGLTVIQAGAPAQSEVMRRLTSTDDNVRMPPSWSKFKINPREIDVIRRWIEQGAEYKEHWAFVPVEKPPVPQISPALHAALQASKDWPKNPIDRFILTRLAERGLHPSPEASREALIRRVSFDLAGLPPSPEDIDAFASDPSPQVYEELVDRLLASPHYGEQMASYWLDLSRYADTYGYQADFDRDVSPWRDWVIEAYNRNLPFDKFVLYQLAGDLLPDATREQKLATAFNRLHRQTNEGGSIDEEFRVEYVADRVETLGTALLGLTLKCARCHDHKYDPIAQREFYSLFAFFNNIDESGVYSNYTMATPSPALLLWEGNEESEHRRLKQAIATKESDVADIAAFGYERMLQWLHAGTAELFVSSPIASFAFEEVAGDRAPNSIAPDSPGELVDGPELVEGHSGKAIRFSGDNSVLFRGTGVFGRTDPFSFSFWIMPTVQQDRAVVLHRSRAWTDSASRGYELVLEKSRATFSLIHFWPGNAASVKSREPLPLNEWSHLTLTYDGSSRAAGLMIYRNGERMRSDVVRDNLFKDILHRKEWGDDLKKVHLALGARFRDSGFKNGRIDDFQVFARCLTSIEAQALASHAAAIPIPAVPGENRPDEAAHEAAMDELGQYYLEHHDLEYRGGKAELQRLREKENDLINGVREIMVMEEMPHRRPTHVLKRGLYNLPGDVVEPAVPERILPFSASLPRNRLGLAQWLLDPRNPLTARVAVNRIWKMHFGRGIVTTLENLGSQGELPTHPYLLDWLANWFVESGWDRKALQKLILMSAAYRQSSQAAPERSERDPENRWLSRGPRHRLHAEQIRDGALRASGLLSPKIGGPSVKPYQPAGLWEESGTKKTYEQDEGEALYRRSLYTFWRRTSPPPSMITFDAPSREFCLARREVTSTPLQSLVLLNDPQFVEAARVLGERLVTDHGPDLNERITYAFLRLLGRRPSARESEVMHDLYREQLAYFRRSPGSAEKFLATGEYPSDPSLPNDEVAATSLIASALMNHYEFVMKQ